MIGTSTISVSEAAAVSETSGQTDRTRIVLLIPVYNEWQALSSLLTRFEQEFSETKFDLSALLIDDGSDLSFSEASFAPTGLEALRKISILELRRNLGHQRAIALGLTYIEDNIDCDLVLVMDGDGEDEPSEAKRLIEKCLAEGASKLVFAKRAQRSENFQFRFFYGVYQVLYKLLTGKNIRFGNFSVIPVKVLKRLVVISEMWNNYPAAVVKARIPYTEIDTMRGTRLSGKSKMSFTSLIVHGLSAISVYGDVIGVRSLIGTIFLTVISVILITVVAAIRLFTDLAIPGWATYAIGFLIVVLLQSVTLSLFFSFIVLTGRENATFLPQRDYSYFIAGKHEL